MPLKVKASKALGRGPGVTLNGRGAFDTRPSAPRHSAEEKPDSAGKCFPNT